MDKQELSNSRIGLYAILGFVALSPLLIALEIFLFGLMGFAWQFCTRAWSG